MNSTPTPKIWGRIAGLLLGLFVGGVWGAALGFIIGLTYDRQQSERAAIKQQIKENGFSLAQEKSVFTTGVIVLSAKMAKSDGRVTRAEIEAFKRAFHIRPDQEDSVGEIFNRARMSASGYEPYAEQLARIFRRKPGVLEEILNGLFIIGSANHSGLTFAELTFVRNVSQIFGFSPENFARIAARSDVVLPGYVKPPNPVDEAFSILGIPPSASAAEAKRAYRFLIRKHHPDQLVAQGMSPEFVTNATEKMKRINVAYDTICKIKGIK